LKIFEFGWKPDPIALGLATKPNLTLVGSDLNLAAQVDLCWDPIAFGTENKKDDALKNIFFD